MCVGSVMKLTKTLVVIGLLAMPGTAANASTYGFGYAWGANGPAYSIRQVKATRGTALASSLFSRYAVTPVRKRGPKSVILPRLRERLVVKYHRSKEEPVSNVPLPASGLLLVGALGAVALTRRKKS